MIGATEQGGAGGRGKPQLQGTLQLRHSALEYSININIMTSQREVKCKYAAAPFGDMYNAGTLYRVLWIDCILQV